MKLSRVVQAFSLIELIAIVGIVIVLTALAFPLVTKARGAAQAIRCTANLKQIGGGLQSYINDHDGRLIPGAMLPDGWYWFHALEEYLGGTEVDRLSSARPKWQLCPSQNVPVKSYVTVGYGWNHSYFGLSSFDDPVGKGYNSRLAEVTHPSQTVIVGDSVDVDVDPTSAGNFRYRYLYPQSGLRARRHGGKGNYLMLDGHVEALAPSYDVKLMQKVK